MVDWVSLKVDGVLTDHGQVAPRGMGYGRSIPGLESLEIKVVCQKQPFRAALAPAYCVAFRPPATKPAPPPTKRLPTLRLLHAEMVIGEIRGASDDWPWFYGTFVPNDKAGVYLRIFEFPESRVTRMLVEGRQKRKASLRALRATNRASERA